ncbi:hypothetical protein ACPCSE_29375 [Streptomyces cellulosae]
MLRRIVGWAILQSPLATPLVWVLGGDRVGLGYFLFTATLILLLRHLVPVGPAQNGGA